MKIHFCRILGERSDPGTRLEWPVNPKDLFRGEVGEETGEEVGPVPAEPKTALEHCLDHISVEENILRILGKAASTAVELSSSFMLALGPGCPKKGANWLVLPYRELIRVFPKVDAFPAPLK